MTLQCWPQGLRKSIQRRRRYGVLDLIVRAVIRGKRKQKVFDAVTLMPLPPGLA
jgi:hypothetical protein